MAKTISELRNQSIQVRDASAAGENTATRVGTVLNDIVGHIEDYENTQSSNNSTQDAKIDSVKTSLNAEIARAKTEESNLSTLIGTERTERQAAVSREETARIQADNAEKAARMAADNAEQDTRIKADNAEKTARENADITLRTMIQTEVSDRQSAVKQEETRAKAAEEAETTRAKTEEERLQGEIDNTNDNLNALDDKVNSNHDHLTDEVARLDLTDSKIKADLEAETARAKAAEEFNAQAITDETARAKAAEEFNAQAITDETARAKAAEESIIFDVSAHNDGAVFESISALLGNSNLDTLIPVSFRHGGMTIRYVQTTDNKYVQARCMAQNFTTDVTQWQVVDDKPTAGSDNLLKSRGVIDLTTVKTLGMIPLIQGAIQHDGRYINLSTRVCTDYIVVDSESVVKVSSPYAIRTIDKFNSDLSYNSRIVNTASLNTYTLPIGIYRISIFKASDSSANITPADVEPYTHINNLKIVKEVENLKESVDELDEEFTNASRQIELVDGYTKDGYYIPSLEQGAINTEDGSESSSNSRVRTTLIQCKEDTYVIIGGNYLIRHSCIYSEDSYIDFSFVVSKKILLKKGFQYRIVIVATDYSDITPNDIKPYIKVCNGSIYDKNENKRDGEIFNNIIDGTPSIIDELLQGFLGPDGYLNNLASRVSTGFFGSSVDVTMVVDGDYAIRTANKYDQNYKHIGQIISSDIITEYTFEKGYLYRVTICNKNNTSANINPQGVAGHVKLYYSKANLNTLHTEMNQVQAELVDMKNKMLVEDNFNGIYDSTNYRNFSLSNISNGKYNVSQGWTNCLKMAKVVSFQNFVFEFDVNTTTNTEEIVVATEETEAIVTAMYGSCAYIDMANAKMYLLKPSRFNDSYPPSISDKRVETSLTNITSQAKRYKVRFGKKERNVFVEFINYYTGEKVSLTCEDATNSGLAGSGYDKLRIGSMSGGISVNSITGISKTKPDILFVGDSVTDGRSINLTDSWAYKLGEALTDNYLIAARAGGRIQQVINLLNDFGKILSPRIIVASVGVNGGNTNEKFLELYNLIKSIGAIPVINTIYNVGTSFGNISETEWNNTNAYILSLSCKHIRFDIASSDNKYAPVFKELDANYTLVDSVHPAAGGSELLYHRALIDAGELKELL